MHDLPGDGGVLTSAGQEKDEALTRGDVLVPVEAENRRQNRCTVVYRVGSAMYAAESAPPHKKPPRPEKITPPQKKSAERAPFKEEFYTVTPSNGGTLLL